MAEHAELISEISVVEKMSTQDRLKHAKKRRNQQLKRFWQYEKQLDKEQNKKSKKSGKKANINNMNAENKKRSKGKITFVNNIMLLEAAARNDVEEVRHLLKEGVSPDVTNEDGLTALHQCCIDDSEEMMKLLIEFGADVNARDSELWTPLHAAATCGHLHLCKYLIEKRADLLAVNADGNMPYDICEDDSTLDYIESEMSKNGVTQELIDETRLSTERGMLVDLRAAAESGGDLEFRGRYGETPLHVASANGYTSVAEFLLEHRVATDKVDDDSWQPVHAAACWGHLQILELLLQHGADLEAKTKTGESALDICEDPELRQRLLEMREEIESNKATRTSTLTRRRSANTRSSFSGASNMYNSNASLAGHFSASVRRTSMREKSALSWKEAREEASFRKGPSDADEEDENGSNQHLNGNNHQEEMTLNNQMQDEPNSIPVTDIDQVRVVISGPSETNNQDEKMSTNNKDAKDSKIEKKNSEGPAKKPSPHPPSHSIFMEDTSHDSDHIDNNHDNSKLSNGQTVEASVPTPPSHPAPSTPNNANNKKETQNQSNANDSKQVANDNSRVIANDKAVANDKKSPPLPSGSLFHLKQMRALQLQNKMKTLQTSQTTLNGDSGDSSDMSPQSPSSTMLPTSETNGHSPSLTDSRPTSPGSPMLEAGDPPKRRFTANSPGEIIGGSEEKNNCCVIL